MICKRLSSFFVTRISPVSIVIDLAQRPKSVIDKSPVGTGRAASGQCYLESVERSVPMQNSPRPVWIVCMTFLPIVSMPLSTDVARVFCPDPESSVEPLLPKLRTLVDTRIFVVFTDFQNTATTRQQRVLL